MGKGIRVKCIVLLILVLCLIYGQQSAYAVKAEEKNVSSKVEAEESDSEDTETDNSDTEDTEIDNPDAGDTETDNPDTGESDTDNSDIGDTETGEETPPVEEPKKEITEYELRIPEVNGKNEYYTNKPQIKICHTAEAGVTRYSLKKGEETLAKGTLKEKGEKAVIETDTFSEGKHTLHIYMENEDGEKIKEYETKKEILIDTKKPQIQMSTPRGFDAWYQEAVALSAQGEDAGSGILKLSCAVSGETVGSTEKESQTFVITQPSVSQKGVAVTVTAVDRAGNKSEQTRIVYIDKEAPKVSITGVKDYKITAKNVNVAGIVEEENGLKNFQMEIVREDEKGKKKRITVSDWKTEEARKTVGYRLKNDGIYEIIIRAEDLAGYVSSQTKQVIIDKTNPIVKYIDMLDGKYMKKFQWSYEPQQMIQDFTTYTYDMRLDGQLYRTGQPVYSEGTHKLTVKALDAAGNHTRAEAEFVIDHTAPEIIIKNVKEGEEYEKERTVTVGLRDEADSIRQIQINGETQQIDSRKRTYEYTLHDCQDYEITVKALDRAKNQSERTVCFRIVPEKSLIEKITEPMQNYFRASKQPSYESEKEIGGVKEKTEIFLAIKIAGIGMIGVVLGMMGYMVMKNVKQKRKGK